MSPAFAVLAPAPDPCGRESAFAVLAPAPDPCGPESRVCRPGAGALTRAGLSPAFAVLAPAPQGRTFAAVLSPMGMALFGEHALWYRWGQWGFRALVRPYWPVYFEGLEHFPREGGAILAGNHPTVLDGGLLGVFSPRRVRFLIDAKVLRMPVLGHFLRLLGSIPVERGSHSLRHAREALRQGTCLGIYPEAAPTAMMALAEFKRGVAVLARDVPGVPVVPVAILGTQPLCSHEHLYAQPGPVLLRYGPPLRWQEGETVDAFLERLKVALDDLLLSNFVRRRRLTLATALCGLLLAPPSAVLLALSRRRFSGPG